VFFVLALFSAPVAAEEKGPPVEEKSPPVEEKSPPVEEKSPPVEEKSPPVEEKSPPVEDLGNGRYRIGAIEIDKNAQRFTVPGTTIELAEGTPIEFLAISKGGYKAYEALLELDVSSVEFNLACILIGLDTANASHPKYHFDQTRVTGDIVDVRVSWERDGSVQAFEIERLLRGTAEPKDHVWVYTGSFFTPEGAYMATMSGTLIGVVHDPESIIQHQKGMGLGQYGMIAYDPDVMPPAGTRVTVSVFRNPE